MDTFLEYIHMQILVTWLVIEIISRLIDYKYIDCDRPNYKTESLAMLTCLHTVYLKHIELLIVACDLAK